MLNFNEVLFVVSISVFVSVLWGMLMLPLLGRRIAASHASPGQSCLLFEGDTLVDATGEVRQLLETVAAQEGDPPHGDWARLAAFLSAQFPGFPETPPPAYDRRRQVLTPRDEAAIGSLIIEPRRGHTRVTLWGQTPPSPMETHRRWLELRHLETLKQAVQQAPFPIWKTNAEGQIRWTNRAYDLLRRSLQEQRAQGAGDLPFPGDGPLFGVALTDDASTRQRQVLKLGPQTLWFEVSSIPKGPCRMHYATDINAVVQAEQTRRNFVQTLTKTFAELAIGLAIFDRKQELTLFNPALIDLSELPNSFLSNRPSLQAFFDRLRDSRIMPEPRDYQTWRKDLSTLVERARDGRYLDTWNLASGQTYRVSGRPHPDGAIAFLFEDISAEVALNRRFRADLELNQAVLNSMDHPIAVFSAAGTLNFCNRGYETLWKIDASTRFCDITLNDSIRHWCDQGQGQWASLLTKVAQLGPECLSGRQFHPAQGRAVRTAISRLPGGATMVQFKPARAVKPSVPRAQSA